MKTLLQIIGFGWASFGGLGIAILVIDLKIADIPAGSETAITGASMLLVMFYMLIFILPGMVVGGIGSMIRGDK